MDVSNSTDLTERAAEDLWRKTLSQVPSLFGRLVYLGSLRDSNSARYEHYGLAMRYGTDVADQVLRRSHEKAFEEWLSFSLRDQKSDLDLYLSSLDGDKKDTVQAWLALQPFRTALPSRVRKPDQELFVSDLTALLQILKVECGAVSPDPDA